VDSGSFTTFYYEQIGRKLQDFLRCIYISS